ncbi:MAG: sulfotransferase [Solirubrobacterales bacterium]
MNNTRPIIVGGCYRSGTSLVRRLLDSHPRIHCGPEVKFFRDFYSDYLDVEDPIGHLRFMTTARSLISDEDLLEILGSAFVKIHERAARAVGKARWADKTPENIVFLDEWERLLGHEWIFVHVARNPLDTLASIEEARFPKSIPARLDDRIDLYLKYNLTGLEFATANPDYYVRILYEDLVRNPEVTVQRLMTSLGESFHAEQLAINAFPHQSGLEDPKVAGASEIYESSLGRWRQTLSVEDSEAIRRRTAMVWARLDPEGSHEDCLIPVPGA